MTTDTTERERPLRADARRNHERILEAARAVFAESGLEAQVDDIARRAGVGVGTVYRHFPTKEALLGELLRQSFRSFAQTARDALDREGDPFDIVAYVMRRNAEACARDVAVQHAVMAFGQHIEAHAHTELRELSEPLGELVARAQRAGTMRSDVNVADIRMLMCGVSSTMGQTAPGFDWHRHLELVIDMLRAPGRGAAAGAEQSREA